MVDKGVKDTFFERLKRIQRRANPNEEFDNQDYGRIDAGSFQKSIIAYGWWLDTISRHVARNKKFRIVIEYDPERDIAEFCVYTPKESGRDGISPEYPNG